MLSRLGVWSLCGSVRPRFGSILGCPAHASCSPGFSAPFGFLSLFQDPHTLSHTPHHRVQKGRWELLSGCGLQCQAIHLVMWGLPLKNSLGKYWSFSFSGSIFTEYSGLIFLRVDWFDVLAVQETLRSLLQKQFKASAFQCSAFFFFFFSFSFTQTQSINTH